MCINRQENENIHVAMHSTTVNRLELLSNELLLDTFEYLDGYDLCQAFHGLNYRINGLLQSAQLHILDDASKNNKAIWNIITSFFKPSQIRILSAVNDINIDEQFLNTSNGNICTVRLREILDKNKDKIFQNFPVNNQIQCLSVMSQLIYTNPTARSILDSLLVDQGHRFLSLIHLLISAPYWTRFPTSTVIFSQLRHLSIENCIFSTNLLEFLQNNTPNLRSLKFIGLFEGLVPSSNIVTHIHELHITNPNDLLAIHGVLSNFPSLRRLHMSWSFNSRVPVMNGTQWQSLIQRYLPQLKQLTIHFNEGINQDILQTFYTGEFWLKKKVKVKMLINKTQSRYQLIKTIYFGKEWHFAYFDNL